MKRLLFLLALPLAAWGQLSPSCPASVVAGQTLQCSVNIAGGAPAIAEVTVSVSSSVGPAVVTAGTASVAASKLASCGPQSGASTICLVYGINGTTIAPGELLHLAIPIPSTASGNFSVALSAPGLADLGANLIAVTVNPPATVSISPTANKCDVTGDAVVDSSDVTAMVNSANHTSATTHDLNGDGLTNDQDVQIVINAARGQACTAL